MLKLYPPRKGFSQNWRIRGTHGFGANRCRVDISARTHERKKAEANLRTVADQIDAGTWNVAAPVAREDDTFINAAVSYVQTTGNARYVEPLIKHFGETPWPEIDQSAIDLAAATLRPRASAATRNRCVYTPIAAILRHKDPSIHIRRPPGAKGKQRTDYLNPDDAMAIIEAAETFGVGFERLLTFLLYSGCRLGEALSLQWVDIHDGTAYIRTSKNDDPRTVRMREDLAALLEATRKPSGPVFPFTYGTHLKILLKRATCLASGVTPASKGQSPPHRLRWVNYHTFRHTWATWMRRYGKADVQGLVATGNWRDPKSAARYAHVVAREEWERVELMPSMKRSKG
jgi:integrase